MGSVDTFYRVGVPIIGSAHDKKLMIPSFFGLKRTGGPQMNAAKNALGVFANSPDRDKAQIRSVAATT